MNYRLKMAILAHYQYRCLNCGTNDRLTIDHVVPRSSGGPDITENAQVLCMSCNSSKGNRTIDYRQGNIIPSNDNKPPGRVPTIQHPVGMTFIMQKNHKEFLRASSKATGESMGVVLRGILDSYMMENGSHSNDE